jgi:lipopolysaccharide/colanic/teichoic acid biosynthesis glycosyltransferase
MASAVKRAIDVVVTVVVLIVLAPVMASAALMVKLEDRGSVLYRQTRIGRNGLPIVIRKFRTMAPDADQRLDEVSHLNTRGGPLFKADEDPRVTRVGDLLRKTSIDELPQLFSVLLGDLSLVGPRPALPEEVAEFDDELYRRHRVAPGVTGLWQAEARHNPSFFAYRHLDLFYLDNWSIGLDVAILLSTARALITDVVRLVFSFGRRLLPART